MNIKNKLILTSAALLLTANTSAATFDFENIADNESPTATLDSFTDNPVGPLYTGERGAFEMNFSSGGINLTATAKSNDGNDEPYFAYLDAGNAGLGVCKNATGGSTEDQCNPSNDDNVTPGEVLVLEFDQKVTITDTTFRNGGHGDSFSGTFDLTIDDVDLGPFDLEYLFTTHLTGTTFEFSNANLSETNEYQFYIETMEVAAVPIPAAAWLFGSALIGLAGIKRKKKV